MDPNADTVVAAAPPSGLVDPLAPVAYLVAGVEPETADIVTLTLTPTAEAIAPARPGQFVMAWAFGVGEIPVSVSAVGVGGEFGLTVRAVGAVSNAIVAARPGDTIGVRGPYGTMWPTEGATARDVLVVAGGLGLAPVRTAIDELAASEPRRLTIVVGARQPDQVLYPRDLQRWRRLGADVHVTVDVAPRRWDGAVGTAAGAVARLGEHHDAVFVCGPELMMTSVARAAIVQGTDPANVWVSLERNMHCGIAQCGRCQLGPLLLCRDGAVVRWDHVTELLRERGR